MDSTNIDTIIKVRNFKKATEETRKKASFSGERELLSRKCKGNL